MAQEQQSKKYTGVCKWFNSSKGFGFIAVDDGSGDIFVHQTEIYARGYRSLAEGEKLEFEIMEQNDGRRKAKNVTGPNGDYVKGAPPPRRNYNDYGDNRGGGGYGGGRGGGRGGYRGGRGGGYGGYRGGGRGGGYGGGGYGGGGYNNYNNNNDNYGNNNYGNNSYGGGGYGYSKKE